MAAFLITLIVLSFHSSLQRRISQLCRVRRFCSAVFPAGGTVWCRQRPAHCCRGGYDTVSLSCILMTNPAPDFFFPGLPWGPGNLLLVGNQLGRTQTWNLPEMASSKSLQLKNFPFQAEKETQTLRQECFEPGMPA